MHLNSIKKQQEKQHSQASCVLYIEACFLQTHFSWHCGIVSQRINGALSLTLVKNPVFSKDAVDRVQKAGVIGWLQPTATHQSCVPRTKLPLNSTPPKPQGILSK